ncbi:hypothetical protein, partial [Streptomyces sp. NPDC102282]
MNETNAAAPRASRAWNGFAASAAMQGLVGASGCWDTDSFTGIRNTGRYIAGSWLPEPGEREVRLPAAGSWTELIGRPGALALRAAAPATRQ